MYPELFLTKIAQKIEEKTFKTLVKKSKNWRFFSFFGWVGEGAINEQKMKVKPAVLQGKILTQQKLQTFS